MNTFQIEHTPPPTTTHRPPPPLTVHHHLPPLTVVDLGFLIGCLSLMQAKIIGGSTYKIFRRTPPTGSNSFIFTYIFTKKHPRQRSTPPKMGPRPPMGNPRSTPENVCQNEKIGSDHQLAAGSTNDSPPNMCEHCGDHSK